MLNDENLAPKPHERSDAYYTMPRETTPLILLAGIGPAAADVLEKNGYASAEKIAQSDIDSLCEVPGFGPIRAAKVIAAAKELVPLAELAPEKPAKVKKLKKAKPGKKKDKASKKGSKKKKKSSKSKKGKKKSKKKGKSSKK